MLRVKNLDDYGPSDIAPVQGTGGSFQQDISDDRCPPFSHASHASHASQTAQTDSSASYADLAFLV
jgi:hypothetical protein